MNQFEVEWLEKAKKGEAKITIGYSGPETKNIYHYIIETGLSKLVIGIGSELYGPDFSWGQEIPSAERGMYE